MRRIAFDPARPPMLAVIDRVHADRQRLAADPALGADAPLVYRGDFLYLSPVPLFTALCAAMLWRSVIHRRAAQPFIYALGLFRPGFVGLVVCTWPTIVPPTLSIREAASPPSSQGFVLVGAAFLIPAALAYTVYSCRVFRGKLLGDAGCH